MEKVVVIILLIIASSSCSDDSTQEARTKKKEQTKEKSITDDIQGRWTQTREWCDEKWENGDSVNHVWEINHKKLKWNDFTHEIIEKGDTLFVSGTPYILRYQKNRVLYFEMPRVGNRIILQKEP